MHYPFIQINDQGVAFLKERPKANRPQQTGNEHAVTVAVHHDLTLELHGSQFSVSTRLSPDQALALIGKLAYLLREPLPSQVLERGGK